MKQSEFNENVRQINSLIYRGTTEIALRQMLKLIESQQKDIIELKQLIKDNQ